MLASTPSVWPDLLRLVAVPAFGWAAWRDVRTRRLPNRLWLPLIAVGVVALVADVAFRVPFAGVGDRRFLVRVAVSILLLVPAAYGLWWIGGFGGADAKALMTLALLFPTYPVFYLPTDAYPLVATRVGVFSLTVLTNAVLVGVAYPAYLGVRNALRGDRSTVMFLGRRVAVSSLVVEHGRLFETTDGFSRNGLDLDALRMYLRWRDTTLPALRAAPAVHRDPTSVGEASDPTDGAVAVDHDRDDHPDLHHDHDYGDPWAAERFLDDVEGSAYGTTADGLREGLRVVSTREAVWISPGIPFLVPIFIGLVIALTYGDLLFGLLLALGVA